MMHESEPKRSVCLCGPVSSAERQQVLGALERLQSKLVQKEEWTHSATLGNLRETLQSPLFSHILTLQYSLRQLQNQVRRPLKNLTVPWCWKDDGNGYLVLVSLDQIILYYF